jgi:hypothetical protein
MAEADSVATVGEISGQYRDSTGCDSAVISDIAEHVAETLGFGSPVRLATPERLCRLTSLCRSKAHTGFEHPCKSAGKSRRDTTGTTNRALPGTREHVPGARVRRAGLPRGPAGFSLEIGPF